MIFFDETTWHKPHEVVQTNLTPLRGRLLNVTIQSWSDMLMRGSHDCPMHCHPFNLMQIQVTSPEGIRITETNVVDYDGSTSK